MPISKPKILDANIMHHRYKTAKNSFNYKSYYIYFDPTKEESLSNRFFKINKFSLNSYYFKDHGNRTESENPIKWVKQIEKNFSIDGLVKKYSLLTMPRYLGYLFNPVSFWFGFDNEDRLITVIAEVNNTFGETHSYILKKADNSQITKDDILTTSKDFHVSPFFDVEGNYSFRFSLDDDQLGVWIDYYKDDKKLLATSVVGKLHEYNEKSLLKYFFKIPLLTLKTILLIHYQALKLYLKKVKFYKKPEKPNFEVTKNEEFSSK